MADTVLDTINTVNTEAGPRAMSAAVELDESLAEIETRNQSYVTDVTTMLDGYERMMTAQLKQAEMRIEDTERKLAVLFNRLNQDVENRTDEVAANTEQRANRTSAVVEQTNSIDAQNEAFRSLIESYEGDCQNQVSEIAADGENYTSTTNDTNDNILDNFLSYEEMKEAAVSAISSILSDGTESMMEKMSALETLVEGELSEYKGLYDDIVSLIGDQTDLEETSFGQTLAAAGETAEGVASIFDGSIGDISNKLEEISNLIDTIKPILDFIDGLT